MKFISLFAGVGGFDLALTRQGHECVYVNEWDKYSVITYEKNFCKDTQPLSEKLQDGKGRDGTLNKDGSVGLLSGHGQRTSHRVDTRSITDVLSSEIPDHDILVGGFPCQAFSIAGKRRGFADTRGTLFFDISRILKEKKPRLFVLENVKGLLSHDGGRTFGVIITTLDELGYDLQWQVLNSKNFGVPQNRERVFIVGHLRGTPRPQVFPIGGGNRQNNEQVGGQKQITNTIKTKQGAMQNDSTFIVQLNNPTHSNDRVYSKEGISPTLNTMQGGRRQPFVAMRWNRTEKGKQARRESQKQGRDYTPFNDGHRELVPAKDEIIGTITSQAIAKDSLLGNESKIRRLTPLECERLQGFPDNWTEGVSDTQRYKQMGNAVTVSVVSAIVERLGNVI